MKIFLHEITDQETELDFTQETPWVAEAVAKVDEEIEGEAPSTLVVRPVTAHVSLRKVDDVIVVSGSVDTAVHLVCSRCASPYALECHPDFSALFCNDPAMAGVAHLQGEHAKPTGQIKGYARHAHHREGGDEGVRGGYDLDITYLSNDFIDLSEVLTEQLRFQIPFQPLCSESCKGICPNCGADLNTGRCACAKIATARPFSILKDLNMAHTEFKSKE